MRRRSLVATIAAAAVTLSLVAPQLAESAPRKDARAEREQVRAQKAKVAAEIDTSKASLTEIDDALTVLEENLASQEAALSRAQAAVAEAKQEIADAEAAITKLDKKIELLRDEMRTRAVQAYVSPPADDVLTVLDSKDFTTASSRKFYIELRATSDADIADQLDGALTEVAYQREVAADAKVKAEEKEAEEAERTDAVRQAKDDKQAVADDLEATINDKLAESVRLSETDAALSRQIAQEQAALLSRLLAARAKAESDAKARAEAEAAAAASARPVIDTQKPTGGGESTPITPVDVPSGPSGTGTGGISLCTVGGITVNCIIKDKLGGMLNAASADGVSLSGGGYRDPAQQIQLRKEHCGTSYYAIYQMSASSCSPPTARPGSSQHEVGLAIDFSNCGRSSACFGWLSRNAGSHGFYNLPSESWHWSTSGS